MRERERESEVILCYFIFVELCMIVIVVVTKPFYCCDYHFNAELLVFLVTYPPLDIRTLIGQCQ